MKEKRKESRVGISFPVACNKLRCRDYFYTVCRDLTTEGAKLITNNFIPRGNSVKVNINLIDKAIDLKAKVMWCSKQKHADRYYMGLLFKEIAKKDREHLSNFLTSAKQTH